MALPLPRVIPDVGPGGGLVTAMGGMNSLANDMLLRKINQVKAQYAPLTTQAEAASKLAYANLMGPQFLAKLMGNEGALANLSENQKRAALELVRRAGMGQGGGNALMSLGGAQQGNSNPFAQMMQPTEGFGQQMGDKFSNFLTNALRGVFSRPQQPGSNALSQAMPQQRMTQQPMPQPQQEASMGSSGREPQVGDAVYGEGSGDPEMDAAYDAWMKTPEAQREFAKGEAANIPEPEEIKAWYRNQKGQPMELELKEGQEPTWAEKTGRFKGEQKQGEEAGKYRAKAQQEIGDSQLGLSHSGAVLDRMTKIVKNPVFQEMRSKVPFFQDKQLNYLMKTGTPEQKKLIGDFLSTAESFIASTVQGFGGRPLVREFDLAQRQKINPNDPVHVAEGKLRAAIALHDIAEKKNDIISGLLDKGVNLSDAVKRANKMVDVSAIEKQTEELLQNKTSEDDIDFTAKKHGMTREQVIQRLKAEGRYNG